MTDRAKRINPYRRFVGIFVPTWLARMSDVSDSAKICYARLCFYAGEHGVAYPKQVVLAKEVGTTERNIRRYLKELVDARLIECEQVGRNAANRYYFLDHPAMHAVPADRTSCAAPDRRDLTGPNYKERKESKENTKQCKPTLVEISEYAREIGLAVDDAENFFDYYTANGWKVGRQAMVDWRAALRNWLRNARRFSAAPDSSSPPLVDGSQLLR